MTTGINLKTILLNLVFVCAFCFSNAQTDSIQGKPDQRYVPETYCMNLQDGVTVLMADGQQVNSDIVLKDGTRITVAGKLQRPDGTEIVLKDKDCVNSSGQLIRAEGIKPSGRKNKKK